MPEASFPSYDLSPKHLQKWLRFNFNDNSIDVEVSETKFGKALGCSFWG